LRTEFNEGYGQISPDGHWMAHGSDASGQLEIYVRPFPAAEGVWRISTAGGTEPRWRGDSKELFYLAADGKMMTVAVKRAQNNGSKPIFESGTPEPLFDSRIVTATTGEHRYDVTADGKRFLLATNGSTASSAPRPQW
jgi:Tol biopolymer transport system component